MSFISYAQNAEDVLLWRALSDVQNGFYIDVGAWDPVADSVTKAFYDKGWCGINIEPIEEDFRKFLTHRPRDTNLNVAVGAAHGTVGFYHVPGTGLSSIDREIAEKHSLAGFTFRKVSVPMVTLGGIMGACGDRPIHFLKIDVEGAERPVLEGADLGRNRPWIVIIEATAPRSSVRTDEQWRDILEGAGYKFAFFDGLNAYFVALEQEKLKSKLEVPASVLDDYVSSRFHALELELHAERERNLALAAGRQREVEEALAARETAERERLGLLEREAESRLKSERTRSADLIAEKSERLGECARRTDYWVLQAGSWLTVAGMLADKAVELVERARLAEEAAMAEREDRRAALLQQQDLAEEIRDTRDQVSDLARASRQLRAHTALERQRRTALELRISVRQQTPMLVRFRRGRKKKLTGSFSDHDGIRALVIDSGLFDTSWYLTQYPDVAQAGLDPVDSFFLEGGKRGRWPHPLFHSDWYLDEYPDVLGQGINPLVHFLQFGSKEGRDPNAYFDLRWYRDTYADVADAGVEPLTHYARGGWKEGRCVGSEFDVDWYRKTYLGNMSVDPLRHFFEYGFFAGCGAREGDARPCSASGVGGPKAAR